MFSRSEMAGKIHFVFPEPNFFRCCRYKQAWCWFWSCRKGQPLGPYDWSSQLPVLSSHFPEGAVHFDQLNLFREWKDLKFYVLTLVSATFNRCLGSILSLHIQCCPGRKYLWFTLKQGLLRHKKKSHTFNLSLGHKNLKILQFKAQHPDAAICVWLKASVFGKSVSRRLKSCLV